MLSVLYRGYVVIFSNTEILLIYQNIQYRRVLVDYIIYIVEIMIKYLYLVILRYFVVKILISISFSTIPQYLIFTN